jgi:hypothetical protein
MTTQEPQAERLGGEAPIRISARDHHANGSAPARRRASALEPELLLLAAGVIALLVVAAVDSGFGSERAWTLITVLAAAYMLRRRL